ncbi:hypothetical protein AVEN_229933-1 [Araneus ventricosus]|uniref:Uncharacterized protein n=1 Tax=Araneus ventricosus TaxID=182803 RepID=A0A4Y2BYE1_ARAVE|nr:hypothetical protein AVEN_229933-1 [Araneus ventricosus]
MVSPQEQAQVVAWFNEFKSATQVQRKFRTTYNRSPPSRPTIYEWHERFMTTSIVLPKPKSCRPSRSFHDFKRIQETFRRSPRKSIRSAAQHLQIPRSTVHDVVHKKLRLYTYKLQLLHELKPDDRPRHRTFAEEMLQKWRIMKIFYNVYSILDLSRNCDNAHVVWFGYV